MKLCGNLTPATPPRAGGVYLVGALRDGKGESSQKVGMKFGGRESGKLVETLVFARVARVGDGLDGVPAAQETGWPPPSLCRPRSETSTRKSREISNGPL